MSIQISDTTVSRTMSEDLVLERGDALSLYRLGNDGFELMGSYVSAADAWAALDLIDA